jgi:hypothetical protein
MQATGRVDARFALPAVRREKKGALPHGIDQEDGTSGGPSDRAAALRPLLREDSYSVTTESAESIGDLSGLSHADAMKAAESLRGAGRIVRVMHVIGDKTYEVDRYPAR